MQVPEVPEAPKVSKVSEVPEVSDVKIRCPDGTIRYVDPRIYARDMQTG
jgi:hypothetical protein